MTEALAYYPVTLRVLVLCAMAFKLQNLKKHWHCRDSA